MTGDHRDMLSNQMFRFTRKDHDDGCALLYRDRGIPAPVKRGINECQASWLSTCSSTGAFM